MSAMLRIRTTILSPRRQCTTLKKSSSDRNQSNCPSAILYPLPSLCPAPKSFSPIRHGRQASSNSCGVPNPGHPVLPPPAPPELITIPFDEEQVPSITSDDTLLDTTSSSPTCTPVAVQEESSTSVAATDQPMLSPPNFPDLPDSRPQRQRRPPSYLQDYVRL
ncbi:hypothetical protein ACROYT_G001774 [Oculina patagonica]